MEEIVKFLLESACYRITQLFGRLWVIIRGSVASGKFNTSHEDSWVVAYLFSNWLMWVLFNTPLDQQEDLEKFIIKWLKIVTYGDDHLINRGEGHWSSKFGGHSWASFCKTFFGMDIRDLKDGISFLSKVKDGWITEMGATFLKHQQVENPVKGGGQADFLPFRESREYLIRAIYSREPKVRDSIDVLLSVIGQAYQTYASNRDAYDRLYLLYTRILVVIQDSSSLESRMRSRITSQDDLRKIRQMGITADELVSGFPTWDRLVAKNIYDPEYQEISRSDLGSSWDEYEEY